MKIPIHSYNMPEDAEHGRRAVADVLKTYQNVHSEEPILCQF